jgi:hypothetical protein
MNKLLVEVGQARIITPDCHRTDCVVQQQGPSMTTCLGWTPTFDRWGNPLSKDPNTTTTQMKCNTCGKEWVSTS